MFLAEQEHQFSQRGFDGHVKSRNDSRLGQRHSRFVIVLANQTVATLGAVKNDGSVVAGRFDSADKFCVVCRSVTITK